MDHQEGYNSPPRDERFDRLPWIVKALFYVTAIGFLFCLIPLIAVIGVGIGIVNLVEWLWDSTARPQVNRYVYHPVESEVAREAGSMAIR